MYTKREKHNWSIPLTWLILLPFICSCNRNNQTKERGAVSDIIINRELAKDFQINEAIRVTKWVRLETSKEFLVGSVLKVNFINNEFFLISEKKDLFRFSNTGAFLNRIGTVGKGPGEFLWIVDFMVDPANQHVEIFDESKKMMLIYNLDGKFTSSFNLDFRNVIIKKLPNGKYLLYSRISNYQGTDIRSQYVLFLIKDILHPEDRDSLIPLFNKYLDASGKLSKNFVQNQGKTLFHYGLSDTIYEFDGDRMNHKYHVNFGNSLSIIELGKIPDRNEAFEITDRPLYSTIGLNVFITDQLAFLDYKYQSHDQQFVQNRKTKQELHYTYLKAESDTVFIKPDMIIDGHFVSLIEPWLIINHPDVFIKCGLMSKPEIAELTPEDNPILIFYDFIFEKSKN